jgi:hypothetical protein
MVPLEIPGTSIHIPYPPGDKVCPDCKRDDFDDYLVKIDGDVVTVHCPWCNFIIKKHSKEELKAENKD